MRIHKTSLAVLAAFAPLAASAGEGWYAGIATGFTSWDDYDESAGFDLVNRDADEFGFKAIVGYRVQPWLALEADYADLGSMRGDLAVVCVPEQSCGGTIRQDGSTISISGLFSFDAGPVNLFARAGISSWKSDHFSGDGFSGGGDHGNSALLGAGIEWRLRTLALRLELESQEIDDNRVNQVTLGATWSFGN